MGQERVARLEKDITALDAHIEKTTALIAKHKAQLEKMKLRGDMEFSIEMKEGNIKSAERKLANYIDRKGTVIEKLVTEQALVDLIEKEAPRILIEFTYEWKKLATDWHLHQVKEYIKTRDALNEQVDEITIAAMRTIEDYAKYFTEASELDTGHYNTRRFYINRNPEVKAALHENGLSAAVVARKINAFKNSFTEGLVRLETDAEREEWLEPRLERERIAKLEDLFFRIYDVTGKILDGSYLEISQKGNLDGVIIGEKAKVKVDTIGAGGYNIQCFHYRTLVKVL